MNILISAKELLANVAMFITETLTHYGRTAQLRRLKGLQADLAEIEGIERAVIARLESECQREILEARRNARKLRIELQADIDLLSIDLGLQATKVHNFRSDKEAA